MAEVVAIGEAANAVSVIVVGLNHRTVPLELLERMTVSTARLPKALHDLTSRRHLTEAVVLSTCNRTEIYAVAEKFHGAMQDIREFLWELSFTPIEEFVDHLYAYYDEAAVNHLFRVASGLDSAVLGEGEILGQVRAAREAAAAEKASGAVLERLFRHAVEVGKRVRTETAITRGTTSVSQAAVELATERLGSLDGKRVLVLGAGEMGEGMSRALASSSGIAELIVANRSHERALDLAEKVGGRAVSYTEVHDALTEVDLLLTCTGAPTMLLEESEVAHVMTQREGRPLLIVDAAVPRDVDPAVENLPGVTRLDMVDLKAFAEAGLAGRQRELVRAAEIVADEVDRYLGTAVAREVAPIVAGLRARGEELRVAELERFKSRLSSLDPAQREAVEALTKGLVNKLLHDPTVHLKQAAGSPRGDRLADALRILYDL